MTNLNPPVRKKVLLISYYFPPSGGAGVQRTLKFVKYLRDFGWEPVVLTANNADYPAYDDTLAKEIPDGVKVYRSTIVEPYRFYRKLTGRAEGEATDIATLTLDSDQKQKWTERLAEWVRSAFFVPDARIGWLPFAYNLGKKIIERENIDVIYSTAPPYTTHLIGLALHKKSNLPWVVDFRDSWIGWLSTPQWRPKLSRALEKWMERSVLRDASTLISVTPGVKEDLLSRNPQYRDERWKLLYNGFDPEDFENVEAKPKSIKTTIIYTGSLYGNRNPEYLVQALESLQKENPDFTEKLRLLFVGRVGEPIIKRLDSSSISHLVERIPYVTHSESIAWLKSADISLLIIDDSPENYGILTGKLFEYIGAGHPVLALAPDGDAAQLIKKYDLGSTAHPKNPDEIKKALFDIVEQADKKKISAKEFTAFSRHTLTGELAKHFDQLIKK